MKRYTSKNKDGVNEIKSRGIQAELNYWCTYFSGYDNCIVRGDAVDCLAEYEDIGLTPGQLREIDKLYKEKCEEVAKLQERIRRANAAYQTVYERLQKYEQEADWRKNGRTL
jgi:hypothetical protein